MLPSKDKLNICFAHPAYQMAARFAARGTGIAQLNRDRHLMETDVGRSELGVVVIALRAEPPSK